MMLSKTQENHQKFKYQPLKTQSDIKKFKRRVIVVMSDYLDDLLQEFVVVHKKSLKKQKVKELTISIKRN